MLQIYNFFLKEKGINEIEQNGEMKLGLKLISDLSENITYVHSLETNNVIMRFPLEKNRENK